MEEEKYNHEESKMTVISNESRPPQKKNTVKDWITEIVVPLNSSEDEDEGDDEGEEEEEEEEENEEEDDEKDGEEEGSET